MLQKENSELRSQLEVTQIEVKKEYVGKYREFEDEKRCDIAIQTDIQV